MSSSRNRLKSTVASVWCEARGPIALGFLLAIAWFSSWSQVAPKPVPAEAPETVFSSGRAMAHLNQIARAAHPTGSPEHSRVREYLLQEFRDLGYVPEVQTTTIMEFLRLATVRNIMVRIPGAEPGNPAVLVTAHYDSAGIAVGAGDDGSGVVAILEAVRALGTGPHLKNDLIVLITDAEELGLLGAQAFAEEHPWMADVAVVLGIEMRGGGGPAAMFETGANNGWIIEVFRTAAPRPWANSISQEIYRRMGNNTDFSVFREKGIQGLNFAGLGNPSVYHQTYDTPENFSEATLQHQGSQILAMMRHLGNADLVFPEAPDVSYFTVPLLGLVVFGSIWNWIIGGLVVVAWLLALAWFCKRESAIKSMLAGVVMAAVYLGAVAWLSQLLVSWRLGAHPEAGALLASLFHREGWYVLAIAAFAFASAALVLELFSRWFSAAGLIVGALMIPVGLAGFLTFAVPFGAMNLQWPALAACVAVLALVGTQRFERVSLGRWFLILLAAVPVLLIATSVIEGIWLSMSLRLAPAIGLLIGITVILLLPTIRILGEARWWWTPSVGALASVVFLAVGIGMAEPAPNRPAPSVLLYALDRGQESAQWVTDARRSEADPGIAWATERVGKFGEKSFLRGFATWSLPCRTTAAPVVDTPLPDVSLVEDGAVSDGRVSLAIGSGVGAEMMTIILPEDAPRVLAVNGRELPAEGRRLVEHWGVPEGALGLVLAFAPSGDAFSFVVVEHLLRPEEILGQEFFARPPELAPDIRMFSDRAMIRTPVSVDPHSRTVEIGHAAMNCEANADQDEAAQPGLESGSPGGGGLSVVYEGKSTRPQANFMERISTFSARAPGSVFRDCEKCPQLVVVPAGSFEMGSPMSEEDRFDWEGPLHRVTIAEPFAVGVNELTFSEWEACVADEGCGGYRPAAEGMGRGRRPAINISWNDAQLYLKWISEKTGKPYRLLSESEWEYVARAGKSTPFYTGDTVSTDQVNFRGWRGVGAGRKETFRDKTMPVGSFKPNQFGLHDVSGNVWEWVQDCWNEDYRGAPAYGNAWGDGNCDVRVIRGGSFGDYGGEVRLAVRYRVSSKERSMTIGVRIARSLDSQEIQD